MSTIKAGYRVTISSWENDGDHRHNTIIDGLSEETTRLYVSFAKLFYSAYSVRKNNIKGASFFGNMYQPDEKEEKEVYAAIRKVFETNINELKNMYELTDSDFEDQDCIREIAGSLHYELFGASEYRFRVLEKVTVEYIPVEIKIENVTNKF